MQLLGSILCNQLLKVRGAHEVMALGAAVCLGGGAVVFLGTVPFDSGLWMTMAGMWLFMLGFGLIVPSSTGLTLHAFGAIGGLAAAILGTAQSLIGSLGSAMSALLYNGTPYSLGVGIGLSAVLACLSAGALSRRLKKNPELLDTPEEMHSAHHPPDHR